MMSRIEMNISPPKNRMPDTILYIVLTTTSPFFAYLISQAPVRSSMDAWEHRSLQTGCDWRICVVAIILGGIGTLIYAQDVAADSKAPWSRA